jgi:hypothetical protein
MANLMPQPPAVTPAKAGVQEPLPRRALLDARFRGHDISRQTKSELRSTESWPI